MCGLSKEEFCARAPVFVGDILWEHLVLLQQDVDREKAALKNAPSNLSETSTDPVSLPPSPPSSQHYPVSHSPQKTYHTLSPSRHTPIQLLLLPSHTQTLTAQASNHKPHHLLASSQSIQQ